MESRQAIEKAVFSIRDEVLSAFERGEELSGLLRRLCLGYETHSPHDVRCSILLNENGRMVHGAGPSLPDGFLDYVDNAPVREAVGSCGTALHRGETVLTSDIASDPLWSDYPDAHEVFGLEACWSIPVIVDGDALASFAVYAERDRLPGEFEMALLKGVSGLAGVVISRVELKERLDRERRRLAEILEAVGIAVWEWNLTTNEATLNDLGCRLLGYESIEEIHEYAGEQLPALIHEHDIFALETALKPVFDGQVDRYEIDIRFKHRDGSWIWILSRGHVVERGPDGESSSSPGPFRMSRSRSAWRAS